MATSSITDNIVIDDPKQVREFAEAVEEAANHLLKKLQDKKGYILLKQNNSGKMIVGTT